MTGRDDGGGLDPGRTALDPRRRRQAWDRKYSGGHPLWRGPPLGAPQHQGGLVLELGCGDGKTLRALASTGAEVVAVDISGRALRSCLARLRGLGDVHLVQGDAGHLPVRSGCVGLLSAHHVLEHLLLEERRALAEEAFRALRPGGRLSVRAFSREDMRSGQGEEVEEGTFLREGIPYHYFDQGELLRLFPGWDLVSAATMRRPVRHGGKDLVRSWVAAELLRPNH